MPSDSQLQHNLFLGIDPGISGGFALLREDGELVSLWPMADTQRQIYRELQAQLEAARGLNVHCAIERVNAFPAQGVKGVFTFAEGYGFLQGLLTALLIPHELVLPTVWQKGFVARSHAQRGRSKNEAKKRHKNALKSTAERLFPKADVTLLTADALLIAEWCRRVRGKPVDEKTSRE